MSSRRPFHTAGRRSGGYTLLEVVIAVGILVVLGSGLATLLTQGISIWRRAENRGKVYDQARILLERMAVMRVFRPDQITGLGSCLQFYRVRPRPAEGHAYSWVPVIIATGREFTEHVFDWDFGQLEDDEDKCVPSTAFQQRSRGSPRASRGRYY